MGRDDWDIREAALRRRAEALESEAASLRGHGEALLAEVQERLEEAARHLREGPALDAVQEALSLIATQPWFAVACDG